MTGKAVTAYSAPEVMSAHSNFTKIGTEFELINDHRGYTHIQVATAVTFMVGIFQVNFSNCLIT